MIWTMLGWRSRMPASASLWNRSTASGISGEPLAEHLDRQGALVVRMLAAIDPGERPLRQVEEHLGVAEEEPAGVALLEPVDLPAREPPLAQQHPQHRVGRSVLGIGRRLAELLARDQAEHRDLIDQHFSVDFGHGGETLDRSRRDVATQLGPFRRAGADQRSWGSQSF